jgi:malate dehydrogenase (oxaloacetate-decarboxylating)
MSAKNDRKNRCGRVRDMHMALSKLPEGEMAGETQEVSLTGQFLLDNPLLNKGSAFSEEERRELGLLGLLPPHVSTLDEQLARTYGNYKCKQSDIERYIFLVSLQNRNETLFYKLLEEHITEMLPIIYTPVVGEASQTYSHIYSRPRGLYISYPHRFNIESILRNAPARDYEVIVVTDGERILGLGDLGIGGMGIPVGKLSLYTLCAGIDPATTLPIVLDVGTNNERILADPLYLGWRHERVRGGDYDDFIELFVREVERVLGGALLQWEDFSKNNASRLLYRYRDQLLTFNDDIQGTGAVTLAGLLAAASVTGTAIRHQRIVILGAGSSATGISAQLVAARMSEGLTESEARAGIWLIDSKGLVHSGRADLEPFKRPYARPAEQVNEWRTAETGHITLEDVIRNVQPTTLIGTSAQPGAFTESLIRQMARLVERPVIFPLSNPTSKSEADPQDLIDWTEGRALVATGSPFPDAIYKDRRVRIGQCNNALIFPGVGLGVIAARARRVTDSMFVAAARALAELSPALSDPKASLYPPLERVREVSRRVALAVGAEAQRAGVAMETTTDELERRVEEKMWTPRYARYKLKTE